MYRSVSVHATADRTVKTHDGGHGTVDFFCRFFFVGFDVFSRDGTDEDVVHHPAQDRMAIVSDFRLQSQLHQFFGRRRHILEAMIERAPPYCQVWDWLSSRPLGLSSHLPRQRRVDNRIEGRALFRFRCLGLIPLCEARFQSARSSLIVFGV